MTVPTAPYPPAPTAAYPSLLLTSVQADWCASMIAAQAARIGWCASFIAADDLLISGQGSLIAAQASLLDLGSASGAYVALGAHATAISAANTWIAEQQWIRDGGMLASYPLPIASGPAPELRSSAPTAAGGSLPLTLTLTLGLP